MLTKDIAYAVDGKTYTGYLADDESRGAKRPGILVCHQGLGLSEHAKERARMLANAGYVAFALDMYGRLAKSREDVMSLIGELVSNPSELRKRAQAGLDVLRDQTNTDKQRLAAVGYCFGGSVVIEMARSVPGLSCVVAFHPGLADQPETDERGVLCKVMVCAGVDDPLIRPEARERFISLMKAANADWQLMTYGGAGHAFTDKTVDAMNMPGFSYNEAVDKRSWSAMRALFDESFVSPAS
jgi:dienelactone hydrolase